MEAELLMVGSCSSTHYLGGSIVRVVRIDDDAETAQRNMQAMSMERDVYKILGLHDRIAHCLYVSPIGDIIVLEHYNLGNLKDYVVAHGPTHIQLWAKQMVEAVAFLHSKGVRHSDIKLSQWLLDSGMNARLSDFNACGYDQQTALDIPGLKALGYEKPSHFMPRDPSEDNTILTDLFALGSALYELEHGSSPFAEVDEEMITGYFSREQFPALSHLRLGDIIARLWRGQYHSATAILDTLARMWVV